MAEQTGRECALGLPNPLVVHGINKAHLPRYKKFFLLLGGLWRDVGDGDGDHGKYLLYFPEEAHISEVREIRCEDHPDGGYTQVDISLTGEFYLTWFHNTKIGTDEPHNRIVVPLPLLDEAGA